MDRIFITPLANKLASLNSVNTKDVIGTGPRGRITKVDVEKHLKYLYLHYQLVQSLYHDN